MNNDDIIIDDEQLKMQMIIECRKEAERIGKEKGFNFYQTLWLKLRLVQEVFELYEEAEKSDEHNS